MGAALKTVHRDDWTAVRQNFQRIKSVLYGPDSTPTFGSISLTGLTENSLIYAGSGSTLTSLGAATNGQIPIGSTGATPVLATIDGTDDEVTITNSAGGIQVGLVHPVLLREPVSDWYDPTGGLPVDPVAGDRYIAEETANGWTQDYIYEWDGEEWIEEEPDEGWMVWMLLEFMFYFFFSGGWVEADMKVSVDADATPGYLGAASNDGVLRTNAPLSYTDGGDFVTLGLPVTAHSLIVGSGTAITELGVATNGQLPIGSTGADPVLATLTGTANQITVTSGAGSITLSGPQDIHTGADPTFIGLNITAVDSLPEPVVVGKLIHLTTNNRLYFGRKL